MDTQDDGGPAGPLARIGAGNLAYLAFVGVLIGFGLLLESLGPRGPDAGGGIMFAVILWAIVSGPFFLWNLVGLIRSRGRGVRAGRALIGLLLPVLCVVLPMITGPNY